jgi:toxin secretion/phage lysis holin
MTVSHSNIGTNFVRPLCFHWRGREKVRFMQWISGIYAAMLTFWAGQPTMIRDAYTVAALFWMIDTVSGVMKAAAQGKLRSRKLYQGVLGKSIMFSLIFGVFSGLGIMTHQPLSMLAPASIIIATESISIIENVYWWEKYSGEALPPAVHSALTWVLARFAKYLEVATPNPVESKPLVVFPAGERNTEK